MEWHAIALLFECNANFVFNNFWGRIIYLCIGLLNGLRLVNLGLVYAILVLRDNTKHGCNKNLLVNTSPVILFNYTNFSIIAVYVPNTFVHPLHGLLSLICSLAIFLQALQSFRGSTLCHAGWRACCYVLRAVSSATCWSESPSSCPSKTTRTFLLPPPSGRCRHETGPLY